MPVYHLGLDMYLREYDPMMSNFHLSPELVTDVLLFDSSGYS